VELRHVQSEDNTSNINSKNTSAEIQQKLANKLYDGVPLVHVIEDRGERIRRMSHW